MSEQRRLEQRRFNDEQTGQELTNYGPISGNGVAATDFRDEFVAQECAKPSCAANARGNRAVCSHTGLACTISACALPATQENLYTSAAYSR